LDSKYLEDTWSEEFITSQVIGDPSSYTNDFKACNSMNTTFQQCLALPLIKLRKRGDYKLSYSIEIEMGQGQQFALCRWKKREKLVFNKAQYKLIIQLLNNSAK